VHDQQAQSCSNHDQEREVLKVAETNQDVDGLLLQVDHH
ncbi:hypothetical protein Tco_1488937, partial [Tanacetum coccineum]